VCGLTGCSIPANFPRAFHSPLQVSENILKDIVLDPIFEHVHYAVHMTAITYTAARENLASTMDRVCVDHDPVIITRNRDQAVVMLSLDDYESLQETAYLLRSPANAKRLLASIESLNAGKNVTKDIQDLAEA
jgi:antitoxin YefM